MQAIDASVVIAPYLEPVVRGRRVAVFGDATSPLGPALLERGARLVHIYDPDAARVAEALATRGSSRSLMTAPLPDGDVAVRDGAFDAVVVPDLTLFEPVDTIVARVRRLVAAHGHAVFASPNPDALPADLAASPERLLSYYELYDVIALQFPEVRMLGQAPFHGYVIADFAPDGDPDVVVDTSLVGRESQEPRWFMALGTRQPRRLDPFTIVQVPEALGEAGGGEAVERGRLQQRVATLEQALEEAKRAVPIVPKDPAAVERVEALEASLREREEALRRAEARAGDNHVRAGQLEGRVRDLEEELRHQRDRAFRLSNELEEEKKQRTKAELDLRMVQSKPDMPPVSEEPSGDRQALEHTLAETHERVAELERELADAREQVGGTQQDLASARDELEDLRAAKKQVDARVVELQREIAGRDARIEELDGIVVDLQETPGEADLEKTLEQVRASLQQARAELESARAEQERASEARVEAERQRDEAKGRVRTREAELRELRKRRDDEARGTVVPSAWKQACRDRDEARAELEELREEQEQEVSALERTLRERGREIQRLRWVVAHHERLVRELLMYLEESGVTTVAATGSHESWQHRFHELSVVFARREGELQQARWRIAELENKWRERESEEPPPVTELEQALFAAHNEMDALRQALSAEREARLRAETAHASGQNARRADRQEQAVLEESVPAERDGGEGTG